MSNQETRPDPPRRHTSLLKGARHRRERLSNEAYFLVAFGMLFTMILFITLLCVANYFYHINKLHGGDTTGRERRQTGSTPFYRCGDQQNSCEAYRQPDICCPVEMLCHPTTTTPSGIFCCNGTDLSHDCQASDEFVPLCLAGTFECSEVLGGGCCSAGQLCSKDGCLELLAFENGGLTTVPFPSATSATSDTPVSKTFIMTATATKLGEVVQTGTGMSGQLDLGLSPPVAIIASLMMLL